MVAAYLMVKERSIDGSGIGINGYQGIAVVLVLGLLIGLVNGLLVVKLKLNAFITTLAVLTPLRGVTLGITNGQTLFDLPQSFLYLVSWRGEMARALISILISGFLFLIAGLFTRYHGIGRAIYAIGANAEAARVVGIQVTRLTIGVYVVGSFLLVQSPSLP
jgi:simple sugar transport system permease protein